MLCEDHFLFCCCILDGLPARMKSAEIAVQQEQYVALINLSLTLLKCAHE